jgi:hypothetical protein
MHSIGAGEPRRMIHRWTQIGKTREESTAEAAEGRREKREEAKISILLRD